MPPTRVTEEQVLDQVAEFFAALGIDHAMLRQVPIADRRLDALIVADTFDMAVEVKTSRADFRRETDAKRAPAWETADLCVYAAPAGLLTPAMLPAGWGLIEVPDGGGTPLLAMTGDRHIPARPLDHRHKMLVRRAARVEDALRRPETAATERVALLDQIARLEDALDRSRQAVRRERDRAADAAEQLMIAVGGQVCWCCHRPITYRRLTGWTHEDRGQDDPCRIARRETERVRRETAYGVAYIASYTPPILPLDFLADDDLPEVSTGP